MKNIIVKLVIIVSVFFSAIITPRAEVFDIINANNTFTFDMYYQLKTEQGNLMFSPYSMSAALAMVYEGAQGGTASEIQKVFHFPTDKLALQSSMSSIINRFNMPHEGYELKTANALWAQSSFPFLENYLSLIDSKYGGKATNVDFMSAAESARLLINDWAAKNTNDRIKDLLAAGSIKPDVRMILANAIYFKGTWMEQFKKENTKTEDFWSSNAKAVSAQLMHTTKKFRYAEASGLQVLELPYKGAELSMFVLLPKKGRELEFLENTLSTANLNQWREQLATRIVHVTFPKFTFYADYSLRKLLAKMGMPTVFTDLADFTGMYDRSKTRETLALSEVEQKTFIDNNEFGTEAAAVTAVTMVGMTSVQPEELPPVEFKADHPFLFLIQDNANGNILFFGRVVKP